MNVNLDVKFDIKKNLYHAGLGAAMFMLMSLPQIYGKTNPLLNDDGSCPTYKSKLLHTLAFFALVVLVMKYVGKSDKPLALLCKYALFGSLLFFVMSSSEAYKFTNSFHAGLADNGCPSMTGIIVHTVLFGAALFGMMHLPRDDATA
jgi:hypothetical protein